MSFIQNQQKMSDILFAKRNRNYGAYAIRSVYGHTVFKSLFIIVATLGLLFGNYFYFKKEIAPVMEIGQVDIIDSFMVREFNMTPLEELAQKIEEAVKKPSGAKSEALATEIKDNLNDSIKQTINTELTNQTVGDTTNTNNQLAFNSGGSGSGNNSGTETLVISDPYDLYAVDENPEFDGGLEALYKFIGKNLKYPNEAAAEGKQGTLFVSFVVNEFGKITGVKLKNNLGFGLDKEALRVVSMIPDFKKPGKVKGKAVKTNYMLPIKFKLG